jgi:hypothetical protein
MEKDDKEISIKKLLLDISLIILYIASLIYTVGYGFVYTYFDRFNIGLLSLEIPKEHYFIYSAFAIKKEIGYSVFLYSLFFGLVAFIFWFLKSNCMKDINRSVVKGVLLFILPVVVLFSFIGSYKIGGNAGKAEFDKQTASDFEAYPVVKVWIKEDKKDDNSKNANSKADNVTSNKNTDYADGCYRLLLHNKSNIFVFKSYSGAKGALPVHVLDFGNIEKMKILPEHASCN